MKKFKKDKLGHNVSKLEAVQDGPNKSGRE